jgi:hypothetical protein
MRSAIYYPYATIDNTMLIKSALLLWDKLEYVVPWKGFDPGYVGELADAMKLIGFERYPTPEEKEEAHGHLEEIFTRPLPDIFHYDASARGTYEDYEIYPQKLLEGTWEMLQQLSVAGAPLPNRDRPLSEPAGLTVMSVIADCCAGTTRSRVTDRGAAYATLSKILSASTNNEAKIPIEGEEQLVPITLELIDFSTVELSKLIEFRDKENGKDGHKYRELRYRYVDGLEKYVKQLTTTKGKASDVAEIRDAFRNDMKIDLQNLKDELRSAKREVALSKDVLVTALAGVGTVAAAAFCVTVPIVGTLTLAGAPATVAGAVSVANKFYSARRSTMQKHPMAYMYELAHS